MEVFGFLKTPLALTMGSFVGVFSIHGLFTRRPQALD